MAERQLNVVVSANLDKLRTALRDGDAIIGTTTAAMKRMGDAYDGSRTIASANAAMLQIEKLGGVTSLTEKEQRKLHSTLNEGIAKYQAMGQTAPASMLAMRDATSKVADSTTTLTDRARSLAGTLGLAFGGAAVIGGIKSLVGSTLNYASTISDLSQKMSVSTEAAQRWKFAAEQSGASLDDVDKAVRKLSVGLDGGDKSVVQALQKAGLSFEAVRAMKPEDAFNEAVSAIAKIPEPMSQARVALELFGKSGAELLPAIRSGFAETAKSARVMSEDVIRDLDEAKDTWERFGHDATVHSARIVAAAYRWIEDEQLKTAFNLDPEGLTAAANAAVESSLVGAIGNARAALTTGLVPAVKSAAEAEREYLAAGGETIEALRAKNEAALRLADAFQKNVDVLTGRGLAREIATLTKEVQAAEKQGGLTAYQYTELGKRVDAMRDKGGALTGTLHNIWLSHERLNPSIRVTTDAYASLASILKTMPSVQLGAPPPIALPVSIGEIDISKFGTQLGKLADAPEFKEAGSRIGGLITSGLGRSLENVTGIIGGALLSAQAGGKIDALALGQSLGGAIGSGIGSMLGPIGGKIGSILGGLAGGLIGGLFQGNDTKKDREKAAQMMGFSSLDALYKAMRATGEDGANLVHQALNVIGKKDTAANQQWIQDMQALFEKQKKASNDLTDFTERNSQREIEAHNKVKEAIQAKIDTLDSEREGVFNSIKDELEAPEYDEAGNRIYGVLEAEGLARLDQIDKQKAALQVQMEEASKKVLDEAAIVDKGIRGLFEAPIKIKFDFSDWDNGIPGGGLPLPRHGIPRNSERAFGARYSAPQSVPIVINLTSKVDLDGREIARNQVRHIPRELAFMGI